MQNSVGCCQCALGEAGSVVREGSPGEVTLRTESRVSSHNSLTTKKVVEGSSRRGGRVRAPGSSTWPMGLWPALLGAQEPRAGTTPRASVAWSTFPELPLPV